jgi:tetratricopeptide (TPR) repeat protein
LLVNQGTLQSQRGRLGEAENLYGRALTIYDGVGAEMERATTLINLGSAFHEAAELAKALKKYQDALELFTRLEHEQGKAAVLTNIAEVHFLAGRLDRAQELHREALAANIAIGEEPGRLYDLFRLGDLAAARGDSVVARQKYGEALSGMEATGDFLSAAEVKVALAALELVGGESQNAATLAGQAEQVARTEGATDVRIRALLVLGRSVLARRNLQKVRETVEEISWLVEGSTNPRLRLQCATLTAQAQAASGRHQDVDSALAALERIITETAERQLIPDHLEARLAKIEIEIAAGLPEADGERQTLIREAGDKGFGSIVDRAEVLH